MRLLKVAFSLSLSLSLFRTLHWNTSFFFLFCAASASTTGAFQVSCGSPLPSTRTHTSASIHLSDSQSEQGISSLFSSSCLSFSFQINRRIRSLWEINLRTPDTQPPVPFFSLSLTQSFSLSVLFCSLSLSLSLSLRLFCQCVLLYRPKGKERHHTLTYSQMESRGERRRKKINPNACKSFLSAFSLFDRQMGQLKGLPYDWTHESKQETQDGRESAHTRWQKCAHSPLTVLSCSLFENSFFFLCFTLSLSCSCSCCLCL